MTPQRSPRRKHRKPRLRTADGRFAKESSIHDSVYRTKLQQAVSEGVLELEAKHIAKAAANETIKPAKQNATAAFHETRGGRRESRQKLIKRPEDSVVSPSPAAPPLRSSGLLLEPLRFSTQTTGDAEQTLRRSVVALVPKGTRCLGKASDTIGNQTGSANDNALGRPILAVGGSGYVYQCPGGLAYKEHVSQREVEFMELAGDCSITPVCRVMREEAGKMVLTGLVMEFATPFDFKSVSIDDRIKTKDEMIALLSRLHNEYGVVHGDIKPANFLRCRDGKLRLCDFDSSRLIADDKPENWEGFVSDRYLAPNRGFPDELRPPTVEDDWYALAISLWELFTGKDALIDEDMEDLLKEGLTVDLDALEDDDIRAYVREILISGGARIQTH